MKTKPLYILMSDSGDGSHAIHFTFNTELVNKLQDADANGLMDYDDIGQNGGDGFDYDVLNVPIECTAESLGITLLDDDYADRFVQDEDEDEE